MVTERFIGDERSDVPLGTSLSVIRRDTVLTEANWWIGESQVRGQATTDWVSAAKRTANRGCQCGRKAGHGGERRGHGSR